MDIHTLAVYLGNEFVQSLEYVFQPRYGHDYNRVNDVMTVVTYPFCLDTRCQLGYFFTRVTRDCFSNDGLGLPFLIRTSRQRKSRPHGHRYMGRRIIEGCM